MASSNRCRGILAKAGVALAALSAGHAFAQTAEPEGGAAEPAYGEIVVTAQKRAERLQDVPASVSVLATDDLAQQGVVRFSDYATRVPGLSLTSGRTGNAQVTLRGITTGAAQPGSTTGYYVDEAPVGSVNAYTGGSSITPDLDPSDLAQIEVLKGPQGTLYGAGAVGGLLKFATTGVDLDDYAAQVSGGISTVAKGEMGFALRGMANLPIEKDVLGLRVSGFFRRDGGYVDNVNARTGRKDINRATVRGGRAVLAVKLADNVRLDLSAMGQDTKSNGTNLTDVDAVTLRPITGDFQANRVVREEGFVRLRLYNATLKAELGKIDLVSSTTYQRIYFKEITDNTRGFGAALGPLLGLGNNLGVRVNTIKRTSRWSEEARASANELLGGALDLQAGFYWTKEEDTNRIPGMDAFLVSTGAAVTLPRPLAIASIDSSYEEYSVFGNARLHLGEKFDVLAGLRYSHDKQDYLQDYQGIIIGPTRLIVPGKASDNVTTWLVSPRFKVSDDLMVYGRVATGYRPGGPNPAPPTGNIPLTFQPDRLTQYEVGLKAQTPDRSLSFEGALFYTDWNNVQIQTSGGGFNYLVNGGKARSQGGEATLRYRPVEGLSLGANVSYIDAKLTSAAPAAGGRDGDRLPYVPHWSGSASADYTVPLAGDAKASFGATLNFVSDRISDYALRFPKRLAGYATVDLRAGVETGNLSFSVFAKNLTDKRAINVAAQAALAPSNTPGAVYYASFIQPRMVGAEGTVRF
ncbi:TonB-dependent receptor [Novosphingobium sp. JCM 18896]|uniref:TonB-dependent receptor n=1 Tax=Novosphingobium sp. JCM 18896 TaxID=2989731 RepID=UPI002221835D|nr:TonB-dependent receptor [Novosphingobium sp. JCM 18896]MCW1429806.1 TonB-dependent receptor [Novosphingobium sp. JCM 18896]